MRVTIGDQPGNEGAVVVIHMVSGHQEILRTPGECEARFGSAARELDFDVGASRRPRRQGIDGTVEGQRAPDTETEGEAT